MKRHYVGRITCDKCTIPPAPYWPSAESLKTVEIHVFSAMWTLGARTDQDRSGQITPKTLKIVGKTNNSRKLGPWGPRWSPAGLTRPQVEFAGGHAKTIGETMVFRVRKHDFRSPSSLLVRAGQSRTEHAENLGNRWKNQQFHEYRFQTF